MTLSKTEFILQVNDCSVQLFICSTLRMPNTHRDVSLYQRVNISTLQYKHRISTVWFRLYFAM